MSIVKIDKAEWKGYFDRMAKSLEGKNVEVDVEALAIGSQVEARWLPLLGISFEPRDDLLAVMAEGLNHLIRRPLAVYAEEKMGEVVSIEVVDDEDYRHILKLSDPLLLSAPH
jgi:hypothetical protein